ncbi:type I polyketide synthase [Solemya velum gill symbiont]|nr:type I polyketide synthase [Solemya velum gill symbiont]
MPAPDQTDTTPTSPDEPIDIVGIGVHLPGAESVEEHFYNLLQKRCFIRDIQDTSRFKRKEFLTDDPADRSRSYSGLAGLLPPLDNDLSKFRIPPTVAKEMAQSQLLALVCANNALQDSGFFERRFSTRRFAVVVGTNGDMSERYSQKMIQWQRIRDELSELIEDDQELEERLQQVVDRYEQKHQQDWVYNEDKVTGTLASLVAARIANVFDLGGLTTTMDSACASGLAAISNAVSLLTEKRCDVALAGATGLELTPDAMVSFSSLSTLSAQGSFPLDARADGFVIGEGAGMFLLKRQSDALRHGDTIYGLIESWGASSDGAGKGITAPNYAGQREAVEDAYTRCTITPDDIDYLECHATGTLVGDTEERLTVHHCFGKSRATAGKPPIPIGGSKAVTGHLLSGAGVVSLLSGLFAINLRRIPPQVNFELAPDDVDLESLGLRDSKRPDPISSQRVYAGVSSFGFGGVNYHMVLSSPQNNAREAVLDARIADFPEFGELKNQTLFLFPGQGSQHPSMLHPLRDDQQVQKQLDLAMAIFSEYSDVALDELLLTNPDADDEALQPYEKMLQSTSVSQPAIFLTSAVMLEKLRETGITPAMAAGHSLGEHSALYAAGMLDFETAFRIVCIRGQLMSAPSNGEPGSMLALACSQKQASQLLSEVDGYATCANLNAYEQTVISGELETIDALADLADTHGIRAFKLKVERGFHSRLVADCEAPMLEVLDQCDWRYGEIPVPANRSRQMYPFHPESAGEELNATDKVSAVELLGGLIPSQVDFISQVNAAYEAGIRRFVEVGPKNILCGLVDQILQGKPFQTEPLVKAAEPANFRIDGLHERLEEPLDIKRQPLPVQVRKSRVEQAPVNSSEAQLSIIEQIRLAVSEVSGYSLDQIADDAEFERDLGIDTLKIFEILSRLRGTVLPQKLENFRNLTSVAKINAVAQKDNQSEDQPAGENSGKSLSLYSHTLRITGELPTLPAENLSLPDCLVEALPQEMQTLRKELLPRLHHWLCEQSSSSSDKQPEGLNLVTYAPLSSYYDGAFLALSAFIRSAQKDIPDIRLSYTHFDSPEPETAKIQAALAEPKIGARITADMEVIESRLHQLDGLYASVDQLCEQLAENDLVLVSGGARGITAEITKSLAQRTRARFLILGRQQKSEEWITQLGAQRAQYLSADIADPEAVSSLQLEKHAITLMIHGAGIEISKNLCSKSDEEFARVLEVKVGGLENLLANIDQQHLRGVVQFSSVVSYVGNNGQADYAAANGVLNGSLPSGLPVLSIAWDAWADVGMASRGMVKEIFDAQGVQMIQPDDGIEAFECLLSGFLNSPPTGTTCVAAFGERPSDMSGVSLFEPPQTALSLCDYRFSMPDKKINLSLDIDLEHHRVLIDHSFGGKVVTPAAVMLRQLIATALRESTNNDLSFIFSDVEFLLPLILQKGKPKELLLHRHNQHFSLTETSGNEQHPFMQCNLRWSDSDIESAKSFSTLNQLPEEFKKRQIIPFTPRELPVLTDLGLRHFGPAFEIISRLWPNGSMTCTEIDMHKAERESGTLLTDTGRVAYFIEAALFSCTRWYLMNIFDNKDRIPTSIKNCAINLQACADALESNAYTRQYHRNGEEYFDVLVVNENNQAMVAMTGLQNSPSKSTGLRIYRPLPLNQPLYMGKVQILILDLSEASEWADRNNIMTKEETGEILKQSNAKRRREKSGGKLAVKLLAHHHFDPDLPPDQKQLTTIEVLSDGTPVSVTVDGSPTPTSNCFSISHTDNWVCAAQGEKAVGIDIERIRELSEKTVSDICGPDLLEKLEEFHRREWTSADNREDIESILPIMLFTQKEAVLKAAGVGLAEGLDKVHIQEISFNREIEATFKGHSYSVISAFNREFVVSVAVAEDMESGNVQISDSQADQPASLLQESLCKEEKQQENGFSYALTHRIHFRGFLDKSCLQRAVSRLDQEQEILRTVFDENCTAILISEGDPLFSEIDCSVLEQDEADQHIEELYRQFASYSYTSADPRFYRLQLIQLPEGEHLLFIHFHHLIMDCVSSFDYSSILLDKYSTMVRKEPATTSGLPAQYHTFAERQRSQLTPKRQHKAHDYWTSRLAGLPAAPPANSACEQPGIAHSKLVIEVSQLNALEGYCRSSGITLFIGLLTALQATLMEWLQRRDMIVNVPFSLRDPKQEAGILGPFVNLLPIRAQVKADSSWSSISDALRTNLFEAIEYSEIPLSLAMDESDSMMAGIVCQLIYKPRESLQIPGLEVQRSVIDGHNAALGLVFSFFLDDRELTCEITRNTALVSGTEVEKIIERFPTTVSRMCNMPSAVVFEEEE